MNIDNAASQNNALGVNVVVLPFFIHDTLSIVENQEETKTAYESVHVHGKNFQDKSFTITHVSAESKNFIHRYRHIFFFF